MKTQNITLTNLKHQHSGQNEKRRSLLKIKNARNSGAENTLLFVNTTPISPTESQKQPFFGTKWERIGPNRTGWNTCRILLHYMGKSHDRNSPCPINISAILEISSIWTYSTGLPFFTKRYQKQKSAYFDNHEPT